MKILGWKLDIRAVGRDRQLILRKEVGTVAIEGVFTCRVQGAALSVANSVNPVSVGIHYPSKSLLSDTPLLLAIYSFVELAIHYVLSYMLSAANKSRCQCHNPSTHLHYAPFSLLFVLFLKI